MARFRVSVNPAKCQAYKRCTAIAPAVFAIGADGKASVLSCEGAGDEEIVRAARSCPYRAISVADAASGEQIFPPLPRKSPPEG